MMEVLDIRNSIKRLVFSIVRFRKDGWKGVEDI